jgi:hypothetical protein
MFLLILIFLFVDGSTGIIPMSIQPMALHILVPSLVICGVVMIIGFFRSFDRSAWIVILSVIAFFFLVGVLSLISDS